MKYNMTKKVCYSIIIAAMAIGFTLIAIFGIDENGSGSAKDINLGLDLAGRRKYYLRNSGRQSYITGCR